MNRVLLVDDEQAIRLAVRMALRREGMDVTEASDGLEALALLKKEKYQLVILDVMMERVGGYEVLQKMRAAGDHTPVMMLSGKSDEMDQVLGLGFGADSYGGAEADREGADTAESGLQPGGVRCRHSPRSVCGRYAEDGVPEG